MTQTTSLEPATAADLRPTDILMNLIVALLAPMFLCVTAGDVALARMAAAETVNAYRARDHADLIAIAQIVAYGLAALGSLSLSMADEIPLSMILRLRLRGNAVALNRSAEQNRRAIREHRGDNPILLPVAMETAPETPTMFADDDYQTGTEAFLGDAAERMLAAESLARLQPPEPNKRPSPAPAAAPATAPTAAEKRHQEMWAIALTKESEEISCGIPNLPPAERSTACIRAAALSSTAHELLAAGGSRALSPVRRFPPD
jgi:hypothetical protein